MVQSQLGRTPARSFCLRRHSTDDSRVQVPCLWPVRHKRGVQSHAFLACPAYIVVMDTCLRRSSITIIPSTSQATTPTQLFFYQRMGDFRPLAQRQGSNSKGNAYFVQTPSPSEELFNWMRTTVALSFGAKILLSGQRKETLSLFNIMTFPLHRHGCRQPYSTSPTTLISSTAE